MSLIEYNGESKVIKRICELLDTMSGINFEVVQTLPLVDISTSTIYLVPKQTAQTDNIYDEYINTDGTSQGWELIGTTEIDLTNYVQFSDLSTVATSGDYDDLIDKPTIPTDFVPKSTGGTFDGNVNIIKANSGTSNVNSVFSLGNDKAVGVTGNTRGAIQLYDQNGKFTNLFPSDNANNLSYFLPNDKPNNSVLATTDEAEKVKQEYTQTTSGDYLLLASNSNKDSTSDETEKVKKIAHAYITGSTGNLVLCRKHTYTSAQNHILAIGNAIADGVEGAVDGVLRLFGKGAYYSQFYDGFNSLTANQTYRPRDLTGTMALLPDIADSCIQVGNGEYNFINPPYFHANGTHSSGITYSSNENTGEYTVKGTASSAFNANIKRWSQGLYLKAGKYKLSGLPSNTGCSLRVYSSTTSGSVTLIGSDTGSGFEFTITEKTLMQIPLVIPTNTTVNFTFRPKIEKLSDWVDLGSLSLASDITVDDVYSEYMADLQVTVGYLGNSYTRNYTVNVLANMITSTEKVYSNGSYCYLSSTVELFSNGAIGLVKQNNQVTIRNASGGNGVIPGGTQFSLAVSGNLYAKA